jgi:N-acetylneuraminic acid mutarotase
MKLRYYSMVFGLLLCFLLISSLAILAAEDVWSNKADMPTARRDLATSVVNGIIYAIGGRGEGGIELSTVEAYDPVRDMWVERSNMPTERGALSACAVNGIVYAIGGEIQGIRGGQIQGIGTSAVEAYNPVTGTWVKKSNMSIMRGWVSASVVNGKIYVFGGAGGDELVSMSVVEEYDPQTNKWTKKAVMPFPRYGLTTSVVNAQVYVIGGSETGGFVMPKPVSAVDVYDPATDTWTENVTQMPTPRWSLSSNVIDGKIYVIGGFDDNQKGTNIVDVYDPLTNTWIQKANMPTARGMFSTRTVNGKIYAIGGGPSAEIVGGAMMWEPFKKGIVEEYDTGFIPQIVDSKDKLTIPWGKIKKF